MIFKLCLLLQGLLNPFGKSVYHVLEGICLLRGSASFDETMALGFILQQVHNG